MDRPRPVVSRLGLALHDALQTENGVDEWLETHSKDEIAKLINLQDDGGFTAFAVACSIGETAIAKKLKEHGADEKIATQAGNSPLMLVARSNAVHTAEYLLSLQMPVDQPNQNGDTALMFAAAGGQVGMLHLLVEKAKASLHLTNSKKSTALHFAATPDSALYLLNTIIERKQLDLLIAKDSMDNTPLHSWINAGRVALVDAFFKFVPHEHLRIALSTSNKQGHNSLRLAQTLSPQLREAMVAAVQAGTQALEDKAKKIADSLLQAPTNNRKAQKKQAKKAKKASVAPPTAASPPPAKSQATASSNTPVTPTTLPIATPTPTPPPTATTPPPSGPKGPNSASQASVAPKPQQDQIAPPNAWHQPRPASLIASATPPNPAKATLAPKVPADSEPFQREFELACPRAKELDLRVADFFEVLTGAGHKAWSSEQLTAYESTLFHGISMIKDLKVKLVAQQAEMQLEEQNALRVEIIQGKPR